MMIKYWIQILQVNKKVRFEHNFIDYKIFLKVAGILLLTKFSNGTMITANVTQTEPMIPKISTGCSNKNTWMK